MKGFFCVKLALKRDILAFDFNKDGDSEVFIKPFDEGNEYIQEKANFLGKFKSFPGTLKKRKLASSDFDGPMFSHTKATYLDLVNKTIATIKDGGHKKIVTSRFTSITNNGLNPIELFDALCVEYPRTNVYILSHEKTGLWIGASPETLVKVNDGKFKTMALAGSKLEYQEWSDKEKEEQKIVADYITNILEGYNFEKLRIKGVQTVSAGPIQHLRTHYEAPIGENDPMEIAEKLHPTPAVCGVPT
ncbi:MAG: chorismate-binding protein, partial [Schleiferiaceae bacterium]|nr:chorismate-binding protein [Schleiferiaceae bacterium]